MARLCCGMPIAASASALALASASALASGSASASGLSWVNESWDRPGQVGGGFHGGRGLGGAAIGLGTESEPNGSRRTTSIEERRTFSIAFFFSLVEVNQAI